MLDYWLHERYEDDMMSDYGGAGFTYDGGLTGTQKVGAFFIAQVSIVFLALLIPAIGRLRRHRREVKFTASPAVGVESMFAHYLRILRRLKIKKEAGETLTQFMQRAEEAFGYAGRGFMVATDVYEKMRFSRKPVTEEDRRKVAAVYAALLELYAIRKNRFLFYLSREVLGLI